MGCDGGFFTRNKFMVKEADPPSDVIEAFGKYSEGGIHMTPDQLLRFIEESQQQGDTVSTNSKSLTLKEFHHYLFNSDANPPIRSQVHHDMGAPLSHYFIYTSHSSYLIGNRINTPLSHLLIMKALKHGVRVIELDLWPNSSKDNVLVLHGRMPATGVELGICLNTIKEHAFTASAYPVIITLENNLTPDLQAKTVQMFLETFGDMLYIPCELEELPSPENLTNRILVLTRPQKGYLEAKEDKHTKSQRVKDPADDVAWGIGPSRAISYKEKNSKYKSDHDNGDLENHLKTSSSLSDSENFTAINSQHKGDFTEELKVAIDFRPLHMDEEALKKAAVCHSQQIIRLTQRNILWIFPKTSRFTSSNYKPLICWLHGVQMTEFNMQGFGRSLWLMHGMFRANGGCGYVKKPEFLMHSGPNNEVFDPEAEHPVKITLKVKVYMGDGWCLDFKQTHFDAYSPPSFYTRVAISGALADEMVRKTKPREATWTPVWNEEFIFKLTLPEIALLQIEVHEYDMPGNDGFAGQTCLPVWELMSGIRAVRLFDFKGRPYAATRLLMRFTFVS